MDLQFTDVIGADRGFNVGADVLTRTADGVPLAGIYGEFMSALDEWNVGRDVLSALFTSTTTESFALEAANPAAGEDFEKASEFGIPQASRRDIEEFRLGFPLEWYDAATRYTRKFLRDATAEQVRLQFQDKLEQDNRLVFRKTMSALTDKTGGTTRPTNENGVTIYDLWSGASGEVPPPFAGKTFTSSHSHYLTSGAATLDSGDVEALIDTIQEHGYGLTNSPDERLIIMVHPNQADVIAGFRKGVANANGAIAKFDFIPSVSAPAYLTDLSIVGDKAPASFNGLKIEGSYGDALITKNYQVPTGYVIAVASSGPNSKRNALLFREHVNPENRGLRFIAPEPRYPLTNSYFERGFGVGVRNRSAAAVMQITASGTYTNPTWP